MTVVDPCSRGTWAVLDQFRADGRQPVQHPGRVPPGRRCKHHRRCSAGALLSVVLCFGCTTGPDFVQPHSGLEEAELASKIRYPAGIQPIATAVPSRWWTLFNDPVLTQLQARAEVSSLDVQMASARIEEAMALLRGVNSRLWPDVDFGVGYVREALSENGRFAALGAPSTPSNLWRTGLNASWEIDFWGRAQRNSESAAATLGATIYDREAARVSLAAEIARVYLMLREAQAQLNVAERNQEIAEHVLALTTSRRRNGVATRLDVATARGEVAVVNALVPELLQHRNALMNALALLLGEPPRALDTALSDALPLPSLPEEVPVGLPSELAHRRPDIQRAEARLHAATAEIGAAKADFYPRITLAGRLGGESFQFSDLAGWDSRTFSIGPTLYLPVFDGGRLTHRLAITKARQKAAAIAYKQTVLRAWHEVDNALDAWSSRQRQHAELTVYYDQSKQALRVAQRGYEEGSVNYLTVLVAQRNVLASQTRLNVSSTDTALALVDLYKSLGGGWDPAANKVSSLSSADDTNTAPSP